MKANRFVSILFTSLILLGISARASITYEGRGGPGKGKHIVFLSGDEEYRSEEALPMLAKILSQRHGFKCTVLFSQEEDGTINPDKGGSLGNGAAIDTADAIVLLLRFRHWSDEDMRRFEKAYLAGKPLIALRTSTHAFNFGKTGPWARYSYDSAEWKGGFGKQVFGETWVTHWGVHKREATRGIIENSSMNHSIVKGVSDIFGDTDVYEAYPPADATILVRGQVLKGMNPTDPPAQYTKKRATDRKEQGVNDPMMPVAWTRVRQNESGRSNRIFCTTLGSATDLLSEGTRRLVVNAVFWGLDLDVPAKTDVRFVDDFKPTMYGFGGYRRGLKPSDHALGKVLPEGQPRPAEKRSDAGGGAAVAPLQLKAGDHVAIVGGGFADRMQHFGHLETLIHGKFPSHDLVFRNLSSAGDEVVIRHRSENFGSPDDWLKRVKADVVWGFFGFNESFKGPEGVTGFKNDLGQWIKATRDQNYSGKGAPRIVLFGPLAFEKHPDPNVQDAAAPNANLKLYSEAMRDVARASGVQFVDVFSMSLQAFASAAGSRPLTHNGFHLTEAGDKALAPQIFASVFGTAAPIGELERLRAAINEKNYQWHQRYRTVDGYNVYGGRSALAYEAGKGGFVTDRFAPEPKVSNYKVMQEEMTQRDVMTANRDKVVWTVAKGGFLSVDDSQLPPVTKVGSNKPGPNPDGTHPFLGGEEAISKMTVHSGMKINLFASEKEFPELVKPVQMAWDTRGRLWVAVWPNYPSRSPSSKIGDSLLIFEDTNGDGKADRCSHFMDNLNAPTGFQFYKDGVLLMQAPDLWFVRDTDGDGKADWKERVLMGMDSADSHHTANAICLDPGGSIYLSDGVFHRTQVETPQGPVRNNDGGIFRFEPRTSRFQTYVSYGFANPHGRVFDYWGNDIITDATGNANYFGPAFSGFLDYPHKHAGMKEFWNRPSRPCPATGILTSRHFPEQFQGDFLNLNVIGFQGIFRAKVSEDGSGLKGETLEHIVSSTDPNFRPICISTGPEGAIYFCDWHNPIIGHMQHHLRDPNRDKVHGRIYRMTYPSRPLLKPAKIHGQPIPALLALLKEPENQTRELAKIELCGRNTSEVIAAVKKWITTLDKKDPAYEHHMMEALWVHQWHNVTDRELLGRMLASPDHRARAAAARVLCYWRDRVSDSLALFAKVAEDPHPRVRLEAVRAASFYTEVEAVNVALASLKHSSDYYLDYTLKETLRQLNKTWRAALAGGKPVAPGNPAGFDRLVRSLSTAELNAMPRNASTLEALLSRNELTDSDRSMALADLATARNMGRVPLLISKLQAGKADPMLARLLPWQQPAELKSSRAQLVQLASVGGSSEIRQAAWAALAVGDDTFDTVWSEASGKPAAFSELLSGIPLISSPDFRAQAFARTRALIGKSGSDNSVRSGAIRAITSMNQDPGAVFGDLAGLIQKRDLVIDAARGLRVLPRASWPKSQAGEVANSLVAWAKTVPPGERTAQPFLETVQFASDLAGFLPADQASKLRQDLRSISVAVFVVRTVREQMRYDTARIVVEAGKPFELIVENADFMPHNLVVVKPGTRDKVGNAAAGMRPDDVDNRGRLYVPRSQDVLEGTKLLSSGDKENLKLTAPKEPGDYEFVCTFPGHHQVMWGWLVVTKDVDGYLRANPEVKVAGAGGSHHDH